MLNCYFSRQVHNLKKNIGQFSGYLWVENEVFYPIPFDVILFSNWSVFYPSPVVFSNILTPCFHLSTAMKIGYCLCYVMMSIMSILVENRLFYLPFIHYRKNRGLKLRRSLTNVSRRNWWISVMS